MKFSLVVMLTLIVLTGSLKAQNIPINSIENFRFKRLTEGLYTPQNLKLSDIKGSPYLEAEFISGKVITTDGSINENIPIRYNAFSDDLEFRKGDDIYIIDPKSTVKKAEIGKDVFTYMTYLYGGKIHNGFFKILTEGKTILLARFVIVFLEKEEIKPYAEPKPARFDEVRKEYYISFDGNPAKPFSTKKGLFEMFGEKKGEMESYFSKNRLSFKGDEQLIKIIQHYNTL